MMMVEGEEGWRRERQARSKEGWKGYGVVVGSGGGSGGGGGVWCASGARSLI